MKTTDEYRQQLLSELIEQSAQIDVLVVESRQADAGMKPDRDQALEALRAKQREITKNLQALEDPGSNVWENIGDGG
jgi:hypothetical protein